MEDIGEKDIRDKEHVGHRDVVSLNFIRRPNRYFFRKHRLNGLRSHVMEVLSKDDVEKENRGVRIDGLLRYPKARPLWMLRIFRRRFDRPEEVLDEIRRFRVVGRYLGAAYVAMSQEFVVDYATEGRRDILLCGLQEYVEGVELDPWIVGKSDPLTRLAVKATELETEEGPLPAERIAETLRKSVQGFVSRLKSMILEAGYVPDLAGIRNILVTKNGRIKLVDINNISEVKMGGCPPIDDFGYPVCDKSIEALSLVETRFLGREIDGEDPVYAEFLSPERMKEAERLHRSFRAREKA